jgi:hypothetical protein
MLNKVKEIHRYYYYGSIMLGVGKLENALHSFKKLSIPCFYNLSFETSLYCIVN